MFWSKQKREERKRHKAEKEALLLAADQIEREDAAQRSEMIDALVSLCSQCAPRVVSLLTASFASKGRPFTGRGEDFVFADICSMLTSFARANGGMNEELGTIMVDIGATQVKSSSGYGAKEPIDADMHEVKKELHSIAPWRFWAEYNDRSGDLFQVEPEVVLPKCIELLQSSSRPEDARLAQETAAVFLRFAKFLRELMLRFPEANDHVYSSYRVLLGDSQEEAASDDPTRLPFVDLAAILQSLDAENTCDCDECREAADKLGVPLDASIETIKEAHRDLAKVWHPDRFSDADVRLKSRAEESFKMIQDAYTTLLAHRQRSVVEDIEDLPFDVMMGRARERCATFTTQLNALSQYMSAWLAHCEDTDSAQPAGSEVEVLLPALGKTTECSVTRWLKKPGDTVTLNEPLLEVSTDQVDAEIPSSVAGILSDIRFAEGSRAKTGAVVCTVIEGKMPGTPQLDPVMLATALSRMPEMYKALSSGAGQMIERIRLEVPDAAVEDLEDALRSMASLIGGLQQQGRQAGLLGAVSPYTPVSGLQQESTPALGTPIQSR